MLVLPLSFIPPPPSWTSNLRLYGVMIAIAVIAALELARRRWQARGGNPEDMSYVVLWAVPAGLIGARLYHVITDNELYRGHWFDNPSPWAGPDPLTGAMPHSPLAIWQGGLGIPGGILLGVLAGVYAARRRGLRLPAAFDAAAPSIPLAQAIGRWGNYFNQELFGRATTLPWGLEVSPGKRPSGLTQFATFHPTFLYEMLWNLALTVFLIWLDRRRAVRPGRLFLIYLFGYFLGRLWVESLRSDEANTILGLRVNIWTSIVVMVAVVITLAIIGLRRRPGDSDEPYVDGHWWDPEHGVIAPEDRAALGVPLDGDVAPGEDAADDAEPRPARDDVAAIDGAAIDESADASALLVEDAQRASGGTDDPTPDGDP